MNARVIGLVAGDRDRWSLAGDQFYVDLDLSHGQPARQEPDCSWARPWSK